eukprot:TRINITY_DN774135_c0_g1_i1.p1 TRINITY_DN774135_c0_g1~~TRINITY_DN774135_c0_g1_i1.p1  ORF type:complete len:333 (+),score=108.43 TRINITY_DN774135_c0_g1_i1:823-1821(+)
MKTRRTHNKMSEPRVTLVRDENEEVLVAPPRRLVVPGDCTELDEEAEDLTLVGTQGLKCTRIEGLEHMTNLKSLTLRSSFIKKIRGLNTLTKLVHLELYENSIRELKNVSCLVNLRVLDLSYNKIGDIQGLEALVNLEEFYLANNKIKEIKGLENQTKLRILDLGFNNIRKIENLSTCKNLEELWLGRNKIEKIEGLEGLTKLKRLDVQSNRLISIDGLDEQENLEELYMGHNAIVSMDNLSPCLTKLNTIDVGANRIEHVSVEQVGHLASLEDLWMNDNCIPDFSVLDALKPLFVKTLYLERNPVAADFEYRMKLKKELPSLVQIDATAVL